MKYEIKEKNGIKTVCIESKEIIFEERLSLKDIEDFVQHISDRFSMIDVSKREIDHNIHFGATVIDEETGDNFKIGVSEEKMSIIPKGPGPYDSIDKFCEMFEDWEKKEVRK